MAENDLNDLQRHSAIQDARISNLETKFEIFMQSMQDFKNEMRGRDKQRAEEIAELRKDIKELNKATDAKITALTAATDAKIESIRTTIDGMGKHVRNLAITAMVGIIAAGAGIAAMVISSLSKN